MIKTVLITGANKGIGFETARQMAQLGYEVYLGSRDQSRGLEAVDWLNRQGFSNVHFLALDVTDARSVQSAREVLETKIQQLDVLINNAGIAGRQPQNISSGDIENLREVFETNFFGAVQTTQQFLPLLRKSAEPRIVNVSSNLASLTLHSSTQNPNHSIYDAYSCSKTALNAFTVLLAKEFRHTPFSINAVAPGYTATDLNDFKGTQTVEQAAKTIVTVATSVGEHPVTGRYIKEAGENDW